MGGFWNLSNWRFSNHSSDITSAYLWKFVWKLEVPPKVRSFIWKTLHAALATMENLYRRRSSPSPLCPICKTQEESVEHLFLQCPWVEVVWFGGSLSVRLNRTDTSSWVIWLIEMYASTKESQEEKDNLFSYIAFTC